MNSCNVKREQEARADTEAFSLDITMAIYCHANSSASITRTLETDIVEDAA